MVDFHLSPDDFWSLTLAQIDVLLAEHQRALKQANSGRPR
jgi:hypothetical protein